MSPLLRSLARRPWQRPCRAWRPAAAPPAAAPPPVRAASTSLFSLFILLLSSSSYFFLLLLTSSYFFLLLISFFSLLQDVPGFGLGFGSCSSVGIPARHGSSRARPHGCAPLKPGPRRRHLPGAARHRAPPGDRPLSDGPLAYRVGFLGLPFRRRTDRNLPFSTA